MPNFDGMNPVSNPQSPNVNPVAVASIASLANGITHFITVISGTEAITGFRLPRGFRGIFAVIPSGAFTGATGGTLAYSEDGETEDIPIGKAFTMIAAVAALFLSDGALVYPVAMTAELID
jgi:hypothetical protein